GKFGQSLDRPDGIRGTPRSADGQQHGGARAAWPGGRAEELLWIGSGVGRALGSDDVFAVSDSVSVEPQSARVADGILASVRGIGRKGASRCNRLDAVELDR